jgi:hypothetical protein
MSSTAIQKMTDNDDFEFNEILRYEYKVSPTRDVGVLDVSPMIMHIPAFKSAVLNCHFRNCITGNFDALILADIEYKDSNGQSKYPPQKVQRPGQEPNEEPLIRNLDLNRGYTKEDLISVAKFRIKAKCIEPRLSLDVGTIIRIKKIMNGIGGAQQKTLTTVSFLVNDSDAVCDFSIAAVPADMFQLVASKRYLRDPITNKYQLKQKQNMMITVTFVGILDISELISSDETEKSRNCTPKVTKEYSSDIDNRLEESTNRKPSIRGLGKKNSRQDSSIVHFKGMETQADASHVSSKGNETPANVLAKGSLVVTFKNGMTQVIPITLDAVNE